MSVRPLFAGELSVIRRYTQEDAVNGVARMYEYSKQPGIEIQLMRDVKEFTLMGCASGAFYGVAYAWSRSRKNHSTPPKLSSYLFAAFVGASLGSICGASPLLGNVFRISISPQYQKWRAEAIQKHALPIFLDFIRDSDEFSEMKCLISRDLIEVPVRAADGVTYEKAYIESHIDHEMRKIQTEENEDVFGRLARRIPDDPALIPLTFEQRYQHFKNLALNRTSPIRKCHLRKNELVYDETYHRRVFDAIKRIYNSNLNQNVKDGFSSFIQMAVDQRNQIIAARVDRLVQRFEAKEVDIKAYMKQHQEILDDAPLISPLS